MGTLKLAQDVSNIVANPYSYTLLQQALKIKNTSLRFSY